MNNERDVNASVLGKLKSFMRGQNQLGRLLWLRSALIWVYNLWRFYPIRRFINLLHYKYLISAKGFQPLKLDIQVKNGVFYLCRKEIDNETLIFKIPHLNSCSSYSLCRSLRDSKNFDEYSRVLRSLSDNAFLGVHMPRVAKVMHGGAYWSSYIEGYNISVMIDMLLSGSSLPADVKPAELSNAIDELLKNLEAFKDSHGQTIGDWGVHNLVYDKAAKRIFNVDLEGFFLYREGDFQVDLLHRKVLAWLESLNEMLKIVEAKAPEGNAILKALSLVAYAAKSTVAYSGDAFPAGYHSLVLRGKFFRGQRECAARLATVPYDFSNKVVLDFGCNGGGMLHSLADTISAGVGVDLDSKYINAAHAVKSLNGADNLNFFVLDFDNEDLSLANWFMLDKQVDICFLLSICMWLTNWKRVITTTSLMADTLLFESNGTDQQQREQVEFLHQLFSSVEPIDAGSDDDFTQSKRSLYLCRGAKKKVIDTGAQERF